MTEVSGSGWNAPGCKGARLAAAASVHAVTNKSRGFMLLRSLQPPAGGSLCREGLPACPARVSALEGCMDYQSGFGNEFATEASAGTLHRTVERQRLHRAARHQPAELDLSHPPERYAQAVRRVAPRNG